MVIDRNQSPGRRKFSSGPISLTRSFSSLTSITWREHQAEEIECRVAAWRYGYDPVLREGNVDEGLYIYVGGTFGVYFVRSVRTIICTIYFGLFTGMCMTAPWECIIIADVLEEAKYIVNRPGFY